MLVLISSQHYCVTVSLLTKKRDCCQTCTQLKRVRLSHLATRTLNLGSALVYGIRRKCESSAGPRYTTAKLI